MSREQLNAFCREVLADPLASVIAGPYAKCVLNEDNDSDRRSHLLVLSSVLQGASDYANYCARREDAHALYQWHQRAFLLWVSSISVGVVATPRPVSLEPEAPCR